MEAGQTNGMPKWAGWTGLRMDGRAHGGRPDERAGLHEGGGTDGLGSAWFGAWDGCGSVSRWSGSLWFGLVWFGLGCGFMWKACHLSMRHKSDVEARPDVCSPPGHQASHLPVGPQDAVILHCSRWVCQAAG